MTYKIGIGIIVVMLLAGAAYLYFTRPLSAPSTDIQNIESDTKPAENDEMLFQIVPEHSKAEFSVNEMLRGKPFTAKGTTSQVAGDIVLNLNDPNASRIGTILVNARTLKTDSTQRDGAIGRFILHSEAPENEFITFVPKKIMGMPAIISPNEEFSFEVKGDLTIAGITHEVVFNATARLEGEKSLRLSAEGTVQRSDFNLTIPNVSFVASVEEEVALTADIFAIR